MKPRRALVEANASPSMRRQCELLGVNRSSLYYEPVEPDAEELDLMRRMDELHLKHPFFGSRMMTRTLKAEGVLVNRKRVRCFRHQVWVRPPEAFERRCQLLAYGRRGTLS